MTTRRTFLAGLAAVAMPKPGWADVGSPTYLAAGKLGEAYVLHGLGDGGQSLFQIALPARGHAAAAHPSLPQAVAFARRPGTFALVIDCFTGAVLHQLTPPAGRQFNGHGAFSEGGDLLMTSEVIAETAEGRIGLWDTQSYDRIGEWPSGGIGPHEVRRMADGRIMVANGGIKTDPNDRTKLNIPDMRPNLTLLSENGVMLDQTELDPALRQNSIRHLALLSDGVAFAMQWEGDPAEAVPQLGIWRPGAPAEVFAAAQQEAFAMQGYAGSIAATADRIALTSPKGGVVMIFDTAGNYVATHRRADMSGVAVAAQGFTATDGQGVVWACDDDGLTKLKSEATLWDNHLVKIRV